MHAPSAGPSRTRLLLTLVVAVGVVAALLAATLLVRDHASPTDPMLYVSPAGTVELSTLEPGLQAMYHAAAEDPEAFTAVRCYCGCEAMLEHRHLRDCFVRPDGGWERHAVGCGVCRAEAMQVIDARERGVPLDEIVADIDASWSSVTEGTTQ